MTGGCLAARAGLDRDGFGLDRDGFGLDRDGFGPVGRRIAPPEVEYAEGGLPRRSSPPT